MSKLDRLCGHKWSQHEINTDKVFCLKMGKNSAIRQFFFEKNLQHSCHLWTTQF